MFYILKMEYYSATKNEVLIHAEIEMNLENIMQSKINQTQKDKYCDSTYIKYLEQTTLYRGRN